jgi:hypothetical protein
MPLLPVKREPLGGCLLGSPGALPTQKVSGELLLEHGPSRDVTGLVHRSLGRD